MQATGLASASDTEPRVAVQMPATPPPPAAPDPETQMARNSGYAVAARFGMAASRGLGLILISRALGATAFGDYSLVLAAFSIAAGLGTFGLDQAHVYYTGSDRAATATRMRNSLWLALGFGAAAGLALVALAALLRGRIFDTTPREALWITALSLPAILHHNYLMGIVVGRSWFRYYSATEIAKWALHLALLGGLAVAGALSIHTALLALYVPIALTGVVHAWRLLRAEGLSPAALAGAPDLPRLRQSLAFGARAGLLSVGQVLHLRLDVYLVKYFTSSAAVGQYALATNIADVILYGGRSVGLVVFARSSTQRSPGKSIVPRVSRLMVAAVGVLAAIVFVGREQWIGLLFGAEYLRCTTAVACRLPGILAESVSLVVVGDFLGRGRTRGVLIATAGAVATGLVLNAWLVPWVGIAGAATAFSIASFLRVFALLRLHRGLTGTSLAAYCVPRRDDLARLRSLRRRRATGGEVRA